MHMPSSNFCLKLELSDIYIYTAMQKQTVPVFSSIYNNRGCLRKLSSIRVCKSFQKTATKFIDDEIQESAWKFYH